MRDESVKHGYLLIRSAAPAAQNEKLSSEAIAARSKARPWRMNKLKIAGVLGENPGFEFLMERWSDDPALQIVIKNRTYATGTARSLFNSIYVLKESGLLRRHCGN
nr:hypothetical protein [Dendronalium sp. ChiSLP03b]MDZ8203449.1 hypothetical protein [Dendronalium sp. ChiSLP03b]